MKLAKQGRTVMTTEELYIKLLHDHTIEFEEIPIDFFKNYELSKLILRKFGIHNLNKIQHKNLNFEAVSAWFRVSEYIKLEYDIPEILELLPERIVGDLNLEDSQIQFLPQLESVQGDLNLEDSQIQFLPQLESVQGDLNLENSQVQFLPKLESVGGGLDLWGSQIQSLPKLKSVEWNLGLWNSQIQSLPELESIGGDLYLRNSQIQTLPKLESVGGWIGAENKLEYWKDYFLQTSRPELAGRVIYFLK